MSAVSYWSSQWEMADSVNLLSQNQRFVIEANDGESNSAKFLKQFEEKFEFRVFTQWTDNYVCDHVSFETFSGTLPNASHAICVNFLMYKNDQS